MYLILRSLNPKGGPDEGFLYFAGDGKFKPDTADGMPVLGLETLQEAKNELSSLIKDGPIKESGMMGEDSEGYFYSIVEVPGEPVEAIPVH